MAESNKMKDMSVNKLMIQHRQPMVCSIRCSSLFSSLRLVCEMRSPQSLHLLME